VVHDLGHVDFLEPEDRPHRVDDPAGVKIPLFDVGIDEFDDALGLVMPFLGAEMVKKSRMEKPFPESFRPASFIPFHLE